MKTWKKATLGSFGILAFLVGSLFLSNAYRKKQLEASERATGLFAIIYDKIYEPKKEDFIIKDGSVEDLIKSSVWLSDYPMDALEALNGAQKKAEKSLNPNEKPLGVIYEYKALRFKDIKMLDSALIYIQKAIKENKYIGWKKGLAYNYHNLANIYREKRDFVKALTNYKKSEKTYPGTGWEFCMADLYNDVAKMHDENKNIGEARIYYEKALITAEELKNYFAIGVSYKELISIYKKAGENKKAEDLEKKYGSLVKHLEKVGFKF